MSKCEKYLLGLAESDGLAWLLQVNDLLGSEKLGLCDEVEWSFKVWVRDGFESLKDRSVLLVGEEVESDFGLTSLIGGDMVFKAELEQAIDDRER